MLRKIKHILSWLPWLGEWRIKPPINQWGKEELEAMERLAQEYEKHARAFIKKHTNS